MGMLNTHGITGSGVITTEGKPQLIYGIPLPVGYSMQLAIESMTASIKRANYGFDAEVQPDAETESLLHLYVDVPEQYHANPMKLHGLSFGLAIRVREELPAT